MDKKSMDKKNMDKKSGADLRHIEF
ncbi:hypothetical protein XSR1_20216 [Xenorhabdus szentirmaii DSM 16338]|uniref:Uncharacterized protein n=1 Tax=Xenorhabdus szentirmaii DSM 16338 TaxID=1427518 RepID=W1IX74_9GAMM|nr:hypothetical protein XSR1_20216 [Xenorhabdus szentirmaii DSM 16338]